MKEPVKFHFTLKNVLKCFLGVSYFGVGLTNSWINSAFFSEKQKKLKKTKNYEIFSIFFELGKLCAFFIPGRRVA